MRAQVEESLCWQTLAGKGILRLRPPQWASLRMTIWRRKNHQSLHQLSPDHIQRLLARPPTNALAVAEKIPLHDLGLLAVGNSVIYEADRFLGRPACGSGDAGHRHSKRRLTLLAYSLRHSDRDLAANRPVLFDQQRRHV